MTQLLWRALARVVSRPRVAAWLIDRATRTPYSHIMSRDGAETYMTRWWLFNPYPSPGDYGRKGWRDWLPSARIHHILRPDDDGHLHDHPWNARTIVLRGWYEEEYYFGHWADHVCRQRDAAKNRDRTTPLKVLAEKRMRDLRLRREGYTGRLLFGQYHRISEVSPGGVFTLFITWRYRGTWGFDVDGVKVPWRKYLDERAAEQAE